MTELNAAGKRLLAAWIKAGWIERVDFVDGKTRITFSKEGTFYLEKLKRILAVLEKPLAEADLLALIWLAETDSQPHLRN